MSDYDDCDGKADAEYRDYCTDKFLDEMEELREENAALRAEVERLQSELFDLRALADKRTRDERDGWCEREGECWLMDGPCAGHDRHREGPMLKNIAADDSRIAEREEEIHATISDLTAEVERLRKERRWIPVEEDLPELDAPVFLRQGKMVWIGCLNYCDDAEGTCWCNTYGHVSVSTGGVWQCDVAEWDDDYEPTHWHPFPHPMPAPPDAG